MIYLTSNGFFLLLRTSLRFCAKVPSNRLILPLFGKIKVGMMLDFVGNEV